MSVGPYKLSGGLSTDGSFSLAPGISGGASIPKIGSISYNPNSNSITVTTPQGVFATIGPLSGKLGWKGNINDYVKGGVFFSFSQDNEPIGLPGASEVGAELPDGTVIYNSATGRVGEFGKIVDSYIYTPVGNGMYHVKKMTTEVSAEGQLKLGVLVHMNDTYTRQCFAADTPITLANQIDITIQHIRVGNEVLCHDQFSNPTTGSVKQLLHNTTLEFYLLDNGTYVTPGHRFTRPVNRGAFSVMLRV